MKERVFYFLQAVQAEKEPSTRISIIVQIMYFREEVAAYSIKLFDLKAEAIARNTQNNCDNQQEREKDLTTLRQRKFHLILYYTF